MLVRLGASAVRTDRAGRSTLSRVVDVLLQEEPDVGLQAHSGLLNTQRERENWTRLCGLLVDRAADANIVDGMGDTPLSHAVRRGNRAVMLTLLQLGADIDFPVPSIGGGTALLQAVLDHRRDLCQTLITRNASVNMSSASGLTPLGAAIERGAEELCFNLIQSGAAFGVRDPRTGETLLMKAAARGLWRLYDHLRPMVATPALVEGVGDLPTGVDDDDAEYEYRSSNFEDDP